MAEPGPTTMTPESEVEKQPEKQEPSSGGLEPLDADSTLIKGPALVVIIIGLVMAAFVTALDTSIVATVKINPASSNQDGRQIS